MPAPHLFHLTGKYVIGAPNDDFTRKVAAMGATSTIYHKDGSYAGVYVDNETPNRDTVAKTLLAVPGIGLIVVGLYPSEPHHLIPGCLTALEWYPYHIYTSDPLPKHEAYITQWYFANDGDKPPTRRQRWKLYLKACLRRPKLILLY